MGLGRLSRRLAPCAVLRGNFHIKNFKPNFRDLKMRDFKPME
jgi:hypothetical protein